MSSFFCYGNQNQRGVVQQTAQVRRDVLKAEALRLASESRSTRTAARQVGISPRLLHHWQQAQLVAEVGREEVARGLEVRALRAWLKRAG